MGFLDHSTNNIIIDAVLTDKGREQLANGSFQVDSYSFGDDEVDYTIIRKFGRTVGKEKIEKNTPVFEAQTISTVALKYQLSSIASTTLKNFPYYSLDSTLTTIDSQNSTTANIALNHPVAETLTGNDLASLQDNSVWIYFDDRFITLDGGGVGTSIPFSTIRRYSMAISSATAPKIAASNYTFSYNSTGQSLTQHQDASGIVTTTVRIVGQTSGLSLNFHVSVQY